MTTGAYVSDFKNMGFRNNFKGVDSFEPQENYSRR